METLSFHDGNITDLIHSRTLAVRPDMNHRCQMHSSLIQRLSLEPELEGHEGCVNAVAWNSKGSLLISGSDDTHMNIWSYSTRKLLHSVDTGHTQNIFCTKFVPETSDELVVSGAGDAEVRVFNLSRLKEGGSEETDISPSALFQCHTKRVKKLAVEVGNPNVVWSASEDGTLRQHDFREGASCPPVGSAHQECRNILLDLRCGAKKSLADPPRQSFAFKSCDISTSRPHLLLVGGSDAFARLYDRRMLPPLSSCRKKISPPLCVKYFCPMHLSNRGPSSWHLTHVAFSPDGEEVLLNYSGEHAYLMDVNPGRESGLQYTVGDALKLYSYSSVLDGVELKSAVSGISPNGSSKKTNISAQIDKCRKLVKYAEKSLRFVKDIYFGIEACNEVLEIHNQDEIGTKILHECLCVRAGLLLKRKWKNDAQVAIKDLHRARKINPNSVRALCSMSEALSQLGKHKEALEFGCAAQSLVPSDSDVAEMVENIKKEMSAGEHEKRNKAKSERRREGQALSLSDILYRSEANSDASQGGRSEGDESDDYNNDDDDDNDMALDFETSLSGDEERDVDSSFRHGSLNLRIHKRDESTSRTSGSVASSTTTSSIKDPTCYQSEMAIDMKQRFVGHCNVGTDIKQASFIGQRGEYVAAGSDDGRWFIWEKKTGRIIKMLTGDRSVVNCIQCHPYDCVIATSGIDNTIKIWSPTAGGTAGPETGKALDAMEKNQRRLSHNREAMLPFELLERFRVHEFTEGSLHPFECRQS